MKFFTILSIYLGESLIIGAEVLTAKYTLANQVSTSFVILAMVGIKNDERLVKSTDRLRD